MRFFGETHLGWSPQPQCVSAGARQTTSVSSRFDNQAQEQVDGQIPAKHKLFQDGDHVNKAEAVIFLTYFIQFMRKGRE